MRRFPELKPTVWDLSVVLAVALLALVCLLVPGWLQGDGAGSLTAVVSVDGREVDRFSPQALLEGSRRYEGGGYTLLLQGVALEDGVVGLQVVQADCPTQDCVRTGIISRGGQSIVCLPARIIVSLEGGTREGPEPDLVIG